MPTVFLSSDENRREFKASIIKYLNGTNDIKNTKNTLHLACTYQTVEIDAKTFAKNIPLCTNPNDAELDPQIVEILHHLNLDTNKRTYTDQGINYLYDLLRKQKDKDLEFLIELIDDVQPSVPTIYYVLRPTLGIIGVLSFCYLQPQYFWLAVDWIIDMLPVIYHWIYHYVIQLHNLPVIGMSMQVIWLIYYLNKTFEHGLDPSDEKIRTLICRTIALSLNFIAHLITYWAAGTLTLAPALFFLASSLVGVAESIYFYYMQKTPVITEDSDVHARAWEARFHVRRDRDFYLFIIRLIYALTISALLVAWTTLPPSAIFTMAYMLTMWLITFLKDYYISDRKYHYANREQTAVEAIYSAETHNLASQMEADRQTFKREVLERIDQFKDFTKQGILRTEMLSQLQKNPFRLEEARAAFKRVETICTEHDISPKPNLTSTPLRRNSIYSTTDGQFSKPNRQLELDTPAGLSKISSITTNKF